MLVSDPRPARKSRSKGNLYLVVSASDRSAAARRDATQLVADTIRREYYYDESAGVPGLPREGHPSANRQAARQPRGRRPRPGIARHRASRSSATTSSTSPRSAGPRPTSSARARLLMPDQAHPCPASPAGGRRRARRCLARRARASATALLLVSRNLTEASAPRSSRTRCVTLHPQSAVEHLHHLFVAAGGDGSDAVIAVEATERSTHVSSRSAPAHGTSFGDLPRMPAAVGPAAGSAVALGRNPVGQWMARMVDRAWDLMPSRRPSVRSISPRISQAETQRRAALGVLAFVGIILVLGLIVMLLPRGGERSPAQVAEGDSSLSVATDRAQRAASIAVTDPARRPRSIARPMARSLAPARPGCARPRSTSSRPRSARASICCMEPASPHRSRSWPRSRPAATRSR